MSVTLPLFGSISVSTKAMIGVRLSMGFSYALVRNPGGQTPIGFE
jgi:hypothetical protein